MDFIKARLAHTPDREHTWMLYGGGTLLVASAGRWRGPGGNAVLH
jgi:hypothetical protein